MNIGIYDIPEYLLCELQIDFHVVQLAEGDNLCQRSFELSDIAAHIRGNVLDDVVVDVDVVQFLALSQNRHARLIVRRLDVHGQAPLEAGAQTIFQGHEFSRRFIRRYNDMLFSAVQGIEGVEELLLSSVLSYYKLNIIDQKNVDVAVLFTKFGRRVVVFASDGLNELVGKGLTGHILHLGARIMLKYKMCD